MKETNNITVIIPLHYMDEAIEKYFSIAVASVAQQFVTPDELLIIIKPEENLREFVNNFDYGTLKGFVRIVENTGNSDVSSQLNFAVENVKTEWFSYLEVDDEYSKIWFRNVTEYKNAYPDIDIFLPIIVDVDANNNYLGFTNEPVWAAEFSDELGVLDHQALLAYQNFSFSGMVMRKSTYEEYGGMKSNIKLTFMYEFLLRMTFKSVGVMTIPKIGYKHTNQRENSLFSNYKVELSPGEADFWLRQARNEFYHTTDRPLSFTEAK